MGAGFRDECPDVERGGGSPRPHEQVRAFLASTPPPLNPWSAGIDAVRADVRERVLAVTGALQPVASVEAIEADGVPGRLYRPSEAAEAVLVWAHGGGWTHGDLDTCEGVARALANRAGCAVLAVDYRLAPEHPFPAGFEDVCPAGQLESAVASCRAAHEEFDALYPNGPSEQTVLFRKCVQRARRR